MYHGDMWREEREVRDLVYLAPSLLPAFLQLVFQPLMSAQTGSLIGAWQLSWLDY